MDSAPDIDHDALFEDARRFDCDMELVKDLMEAGDYAALETQCGINWKRYVPGFRQAIQRKEKRDAVCGVAFSAWSAQDANTSASSRLFYNVGALMTRQAPLISSAQKLDLPPPFAERPNGDTFRRSLRVDPNRTRIAIGGQAVQLPRSLEIRTAAANASVGDIGENSLLTIYNLGANGIPLKRFYGSNGWSARGKPFSFALPPIISEKMLLRMPALNNLVGRSGTSAVMFAAGDKNSGSLGERINRGRWAMMMVFDYGPERTGEVRWIVAVGLFGPATVSSANELSAERDVLHRAAIESGLDVDAILTAYDAEDELALQASGLNLKKLIPGFRKRRRKKLGKGARSSTTVAVSGPSRIPTLSNYENFFNQLADHFASEPIISDRGPVAGPFEADLAIAARFDVTFHFPVQTYGKFREMRTFAYQIQNNSQPDFPRGSTLWVANFGRNGLPLKRFFSSQVPEAFWIEAGEFWGREEGTFYLRADALDTTRAGTYAQLLVPGVTIAQAGKAAMIVYDNGPENRGEVRWLFVLDLGRGASAATIPSSGCNRCQTVPPPLPPIRYAYSIDRLEAALKDAKDTNRDLLLMESKSTCAFAQQARSMFETVAENVKPGSNVLFVIMEGRSNDASRAEASYMKEMRGRLGLTAKGTPNFVLIRNGQVVAERLGAKRANVEALLAMAANGRSRMPSGEPPFNQPLTQWSVDLGESNLASLWQAQSEPIRRHSHLLFVGEHLRRNVARDLNGAKQKPSTATLMRAGELVLLSALESRRLMAGNQAIFHHKFFSNSARALADKADPGTVAFYAKHTQPHAQTLIDALMTMSTEVTKSAADIARSTHSHFDEKASDSLAFSIFARTVCGLALLRNAFPKAGDDHFTNLASSVMTAALRPDALADLHDNIVSLQQDV